MNRSPLRRLGCCLLLSLVSLTFGGGAASAEIDRLVDRQPVLVDLVYMTGIDRLPTSFSEDDAAATIPALYAPGGLDLEIRHLRDRIPYTDRVNQDEMDKLVWQAPYGAPPSDDGVWHVTVLVLSKYADRPLITSLMPDGDGRSVAVVFADSDVQGVAGRSRWLLNAAAHELTHCFNLHHRDWAGAEFTQGSTIEGFAYPGSLRWELSASSIEHLRHHPDPFVRPGGHPFGHVTEGHELGHQSIPEGERYVVYPAGETDREAAPANVAVSPSASDPRATIVIYLKGPTKTGKGVAAISLAVFDLGGSLRSVSLSRVTGEEDPVVVMSSTPAPVNDKGIFEYNAEVSLESGPNRFVATAEDGSGGQVEDEIEIVSELGKRQLRAVVIGVNEYESPIAELSYAMPDAVAVARMIRDEWGVKDVEPLIDPSRVELVKALTSGLGNVGENDHLLVYFAGHGALDAPRRRGESATEYLLPANAELNHLRATALRMSEFVQLVRDAQPDQSLIIIDACFSGAAGRSARDRSLRTVVAYDSKEFGGDGHVVLTSASDNEPAQERKFGTGPDAPGHGVYTYFLLKGLRGEARDGDQELTVDRLHAWITSEMRKLAEREEDVIEQTPYKDSFASQFILPVVEPREPAPGE